MGENLVGSKISIKNRINTIRSYLKKEEIEDPYGISKPENPEIPEPFTSFSTGMGFMLIPAGEFEMGSPFEDENGLDFEHPTHKVTLKTPFYMSKYQVTQKHWKKIMGSNPSHFKGEDRPVEMVSWDDVQEFIKKLNEKESTDKYRLPSEAEWEYACRAGTQTTYFFGNDAAKLTEYAWYTENSGSKTHPAGMKKPNLWGLYDMNGNVWEWVQDSWHENYNESPSNGSAWEDREEEKPYRLSRGGSWFCTIDFCRSASRFRRDPEKKISNMGFRLLREI